MKYLIFNRIQNIKQLGLREVVSFNGIYGRLSEKNNPDYGNNLFLFPQGTAGMGNKPYMEASFGLENIFKIIRIDYYRRLSCQGNLGILRRRFQDSGMVYFLKSISYSLRKFAVFFLFRTMKHYWIFTRVSVKITK